MTNHIERLDRVFHALSDPTRRAVIQRLGAGDAAVSELARPFPMALPSFLQHLRVLEECGLVRSKKIGRVRTFRLQPARLTSAASWMTVQRALWERRLDRFDAYVSTLAESEHKKPGKEKNR